MDQQLRPNPLGSWAMPLLPGLGRFWSRFFAFILDIIFLHYFMRFSAFGLGDLVFQSPRATAVIAALVFLAYFVTLNGPMGRGQTIGKRLLRLRTSTMDGKVPTYGQALLRTLLFFPFVVTMYMVIEPFVLSRGLAETPTRVEQFAVSMSTAALMIAVLIANGTAAAFNAFKQGLHDHFAKTLVRRTDDEVWAFDRYQQYLGEGWLRHYKQPQYSARVTFVLIFGLLGYLAWSRPADERIDHMIREKQALVAGPEFEGAVASIPVINWTPQDALANPGLQEGTTATLQRRDVATTATAEAERTPPPHLRVQLTKETLWKADPRSKEFGAAMERFANEYARFLERNGAGWVPGEFQGTVKLEVALMSAASLVLYTHTRQHALFAYDIEVHLKPSPTGATPPPGGGTRP